MAVHVIRNAIWFMLLTALSMISTTRCAPPPPNSVEGGCPTDFVIQFKNATEICESSLTKSPNQKPLLNLPNVGIGISLKNPSLVDLPDAGININLKNPKPLINLPDAGININLKNPKSLALMRQTRDDDKSEEEDPEITLCAFDIVKTKYPQLEAMEKLCSNPSGPDDKKSVENDNVTLAACLLENIVKMCPELAAVI